MRAKDFIIANRQVGSPEGVIDIFEVIESTNDYVIAMAGYLIGPGIIKKMKFNNNGTIENL